MTPPSGAAPAVRGVCCPETDAGIYDLMRQYENATPETRPPDLAVLPCRINSGLSERERMARRPL